MESQSRSVYIGSIPFDYTEEQVLDIAKSVGPVLDLKLLFDSTTGKSKGYAFVRYNDHETAASAVRNLHNSNIGNRFLKCAFSNDNQSFPESSITGVYGMTNASKLPPLPLGTQIFPNQTAQQAISASLSTMDQQSANQLIREAKSMSIENPTLMKKLLDQCPQLAHALVETSLLVNLTNKDLIGLCVNRKQPDLNELTYDHVQLLKAINALGDDELGELNDDKRSIINEIKNELSKGSFGIIN
ncbi:hypothetical protein HYPBUDRAFT_151484 [Hyphopichia burtonii NRRL Y-1933]|uniref:RRM domain-containing protein n=1 Tax=Hyphopichia burtonii NRRL Y-1933 TaxID=984485 RepID=A0A1E4RRP8_9ASCO|nr:hypothetical protein HYPBUDRAFT_151484 [Hyphopichia burtonii NRRL Y-1933]ODV69942.1 hypothetical protein HYPBUDRAFT_151484 [Hyphopichia burtonii NRRL Y-1933]